jgi:DNA-binding NtrC family response regulator
MLAIPKLLIADDDATLREALREAFLRRGFSVTVAEDGERGLDIAKRQAIHLALIDYQMPRLTGLQLLAELQRLKPELPCILMSGAMDDQVREEATRMRAYGVMPKPLRLGEIHGLVHQALENVYGWQPR